MRLDVALEQRGLAPSRARARDAILRGTVSVNDIVATKPNQQVSDADTIALDDPAASYVSRAALKLIAGLDAAQFDPSGKTCLDLGASTGGFTQVLIERGARRVYAVDVGHGQLHEEIGALPQVVSLEGTNAKALGPDMIGEPIEMLVCDVSFVSLIKVIDSALALCAPGAQAVLLIKPQFEVGRDHIGKGGLVEAGPHVDGAIAAVIAHMGSLGWRLIGKWDSPVKGGDGNAETLAGFVHAL